MKIPKCCGEVIENTAMNEPFFYCRGCKREVPEDGWPVLEDAPKDPKSDWGNLWFKVGDMLSTDLLGSTGMVCAIDPRLEKVHLSSYTFGVGAVGPIFIMTFDEVRLYNPRPVAGAKPAATSTLRQIFGVNGQTIPPTTLTGNVVNPNTFTGGLQSQGINAPPILKCPHKDVWSIMNNNGIGYVTRCATCGKDMSKP